MKSKATSFLEYFLVPVPVLQGHFGYRFYPHCHRGVDVLIRRLNTVSSDGLTGLAHLHEADTDNTDEIVVTLPDRGSARVPKGIPVSTIDGRIALLSFGVPAILPDDISA